MRDSRKTRIRCGIILAVAWTNVFADDQCRFSANASCELASAYISTTGGLYDTCPVTSQTLGWWQGLGGFGYIDGYFWLISALHDKQHESHRALFYYTEGAIRYGYDIAFSDDFVLRTKCGPYWGLAIGYENAHMKCWGPSAFAESYWMDHRRFYARYGGKPEEKTVLGGAVAFIVLGVRLDWSVSQDVKLYASASQYDVVNPQARDSIRHGGHYYDKCDWPIFKIGVSYAF